jgi:hypothetical protein
MKREIRGSVQILAGILTAAILWILATSAYHTHSLRQSSTLSLEESYAAALEWFLQQVDTSGLFAYAYDADGEVDRLNNNEIRQLMAGRLLAELSLENLTAYALHKRNLAAILNEWYRTNGQISYIEYDGVSKLGANAMALRLLTASPMLGEHGQVLNFL